MFKTYDTDATWIESRDDYKSVSKYAWTWRYSAGLATYVVEVYTWTHLQGHKPTPPPSSFPPIFGSGLVRRLHLRLNSGDVLSAVVANEGAAVAWFFDKRVQSGLDSITYHEPSHTVYGKKIANTSTLVVDVDCVSYIFGESIDSTNQAVLVHDLNLEPSREGPEETNNSFRDVMSAYVWFWEARSNNLYLNTCTFGSGFSRAKGLTYTKPASKKGTISIISEYTERQ